MATPQLTKYTLAGQLGPILIDVRVGTGAITSPQPAVVILHGFKGFKDWGMFPPLADRLAKAGFTAVSLNVSGSGVDDEGHFAWPDRFGHNTFNAELADIATVFEALDEGQLGVPQPSSIGLVGHSRGGGVSILAAARLPRVSALVTWAAVATVERWGDQLREQWRRDGLLNITNARTGEVLPMYIDVLDEVEAEGAESLSIVGAAERLTIPWLLIHGAADEAVPVAEAEHLWESARRGEGRASFIVQNTGHTFGAVHPFAGFTPALEQVIDRTTAFFSTRLQ